MSELLDRFKRAVEGKQFRIYHEAFSPFMVNVSWSNQTNFAMYALSRNREMFMLLEDYSFLSKNVFRRYLSREVTLEQLESEFATYAEFVRETYDRLIGDDLTLWTEADLCRQARTLRERLTESIGNSIYIETFDSEEVIEVLGESVRERMETLWPMMSDPVFESFVMRKKRIILEGYRKESDFEVLATTLRYLFIDYTAALDLAEIREEIDKLLADVSALTAEVAEYGNEIERKQGRYRDWLATLDDDDRRMAEYCQFVMRFRDIRKDTISQTEMISVLIGRELFRRAGIDESLVFRTIMQEMENGVAWLQENKERFRKRMDGLEFFLVTHADVGEVRETEYESAKRDIDLFLREQDEHKERGENTVSGQVAFRGRVRGRVRVIIDPRNGTQLEKGDILVTGMTRPDFIPLLEKAVAIVTNEGGITCHAAIVAREMKKPCIIGTKIATQVLQTGDLIEVDADHGVVTILERAKEEL